MRRVEFTIDEDDELTGVDTISLVENPAMGSEFVAMAKHGQSLSDRTLSHLIRWAELNKGLARWQALKDLSTVLLPHDKHAQRVMVHKLVEVLGL